jgi:helicase MOV-10
LIPFIQGDLILVQEQNINNDKWFEGHVHIIRKAELGLRFHTSFDRFDEGKLFHVRFKPSRLPMRRQHQALNTDFREDRILFPEARHLLQGRIMSNEELRLNLFNPLIANNELQLQAIGSILSLPAGSPPFIVFGPFVPVVRFMNADYTFSLQTRYRKDNYHR